MCIRDSSNTKLECRQVPALSKVLLCTNAPVRAQSGARRVVSIRIRLLLLVLGTVFLPALLVGGRYFQDRSKEIDAAIAGLAATARTIASNFSPVSTPVPSFKVGASFTASSRSVVPLWCAVFAILAARS